MVHRILSARTEIPHSPRYAKDHRCPLPLSANPARLPPTSPSQSDFSKWEVSDKCR